MVERRADDASAARDGSVTGAHTWSMRIAIAGTHDDDACTAWPTPPAGPAGHTERSRPALGARAVANPPAARHSRTAR